MTSQTDIAALRGLLERLRVKGEQVSAIDRKMMEAKSLRQPGNPEGRTDLYSWTRPEDTIEHRVAKATEALLDELERLRAESADR